MRREPLQPALAVAALQPPWPPLSEDMSRPQQNGVSRFYYLGHTAWPLVYESCSYCVRAVRVVQPKHLLE